MLSLGPLEPKSLFPVAEAAVISVGRTQKHRLTGSVRQPFMALPGTYPTPFSRFDSFVLAVAWTPSLTFALVPKAIENAALSVSAPTVTGKPSRALEQVELFPARAFSSGPRRPHDLRHGTSRCSWVPCPDTLNEAGLIDHTARVRPQAAGSYSYTR